MNFFFNVCSLIKATAFQSGSGSWLIIAFSPSAQFNPAIQRFWVHIKKSIPSVIPKVPEVMLLYEILPRSHCNKEQINLLLVTDNKDEGAVNYLGRTTYTVCLTALALTSLGVKCRLSFPTSRNHWRYHLRLHYPGPDPRVKWY